jgi:hypothetical protein
LGWVLYLPLNDVVTSPSCRQRLFYLWHCALVSAAHNLLLSISNSNPDLKMAHMKKRVLDSELLPGGNILYIIESNPRPFYSFRGLKNQMRY